jgi:hypothetical protein
MFKKISPTPFPQNEGGTGLSLPEEEAGTFSEEEVKEGSHPKLLCKPPA